MAIIVVFLLMELLKNMTFKKGLVLFGCFFCLFIVYAACFRARNGHIDDDDFHSEIAIEEEVVIEDTPSGNNTAYPDDYQPGDAPPSRPPGF